MTMQIYRLLLRLYPAAFRAEYGEEMAAIFAEERAAAHRHGAPALLGLLLREWLGLLIGALRERMAGRGRRRTAGPGPLETALARWAARGIAVLATLWWDLVLLTNEDAHPAHVLGALAATALVASGLALGRRRERLGGLLLIGAGAALLAALTAPLGVSTMDWWRLPLLAAACLPHVVAGALLYDCGRCTPRARAERRPAGRPPLALTLGGALALGLSWYVLLIFTLAMTEIILAPWDTVGEPIRPPVGTWQRSANDFFERGVGAVAPTAAALLAGAIGLAPHLRSAAARARALWAGAAASLAFCALVLAARLAGSAIAPLVGVDPIGYEHTWLGAIAMLAGLPMLATAPGHLVGGRQPAAEG